MLDELGLLPALRALAERITQQARIELRCELDETLVCSPEHTFTFYRVAQEALTNVVRHADARHASMSLTRSGDWMRLALTVDGRGFAQGMKPHLGLLGMRERLAAVGGRLTLDSTSQGTRLLAEIPVEPGTGP